MLWSLLVPALASDVVWVLSPEDVTTSAPVVMKSPKELEVGQPALDCGVLVTLLTTGEHDYLPTSSCTDPKLFEALKEAAMSVTYSWTTPNTDAPTEPAIERGADAVILMGVEWPDDEAQPIKLVPRLAVPGAYAPPAKYVGAAKKLSAEQKHCTLDVHILRAGAAEIDHFIECDPVIQKAVTPAFAVWSWTVGGQVPRRALHQIIRLDFIDAVPVAGKPKPLVMVSGLGPRLDPKHKQPDMPEDVSREAKGSPECWLDVSVGADGAVTATKALDCHEELVTAAQAAASAWNYLPAERDGALVADHVWVKVEFVTD